MKYTIELPDELNAEYELLAEQTSLKVEKLLVAAAERFFDEPITELADFQRAAEELDEAFVIKRRATDALVEALEDLAR